MKRRDFLRAAPIGLAPAATLAAFMAGAQSVEAAPHDPMAELQRHATEVHRLLSETMPADGKIGPFFQIDADGAVLATGPDGLTFRSKKGGWRQEGNGWGSTERGTI